MNERLEEIEKDWYDNDTFIAQNAEWLIEYAKEQAERVEELEEENTGLKQDLKDILDKLESVSDV